MWQPRSRGLASTCETGPNGLFRRPAAPRPSGRFEGRPHLALSQNASSPCKPAQQRGSVRADEATCGDEGVRHLQRRPGPRIWPMHTSRWRARRLERSDPESTHERVNPYPPESTRKRVNSQPPESTRKRVNPLPPESTHERVNPLAFGSTRERVNPFPPESTRERVNSR